MQDHKVMLVQMELSELLEKMDQLDLKVTRDLKDHKDM
jgi:hypothetical protein